MIRIERGLVGMPSKQKGNDQEPIIEFYILKDLESCYISYRNPLYIDVYVSTAPQPALVPASRYAGNAARSYINIYTKTDKD